MTLWESVFNCGGKKCVIKFNQNTQKEDKKRAVFYCTVVAFKVVSCFSKSVLGECKCKCSKVAGCQWISSWNFFLCSKGWWENNAERCCSCLAAVSYKIEKGECKHKCTKVARGGNESLLMRHGGGGGERTMQRAAASAAAVAAASAAI